MIMNWKDTEGCRCSQYKKLPEVSETNRQCRYNVTLRYDHATTVAVEKQAALHPLNVCL
jgi:hypothetical protein